MSAGIDAAAPARIAGPGVQAWHQAELDAGRFHIQRCGGCGRHVYFPRTGCPHCGRLGLDWVEPAGWGTVHAVTLARRPPADGGDTAIVLVDLDEGVRLMGHVVDRPPEAVAIGLRVRSRVDIHDGRGRVVFTAGEATAP